MTRAERAAEKVRKEKEKRVELERKYKEALAAQDVETRKAEAQEREATRKDDDKKRYHWGAVAQEAGLFGWSNADWQAVCAALARLKDVPNPAAVLEGLLCENGVELSEVAGYLGTDTPIRARIFPLPVEGGSSEAPPLETSAESDCKEAKKKVPPAGKVFA